MSGIESIIPMCSTTNVEHGDTPSGPALEGSSPLRMAEGNLPAVAMLGDLNGLQKAILEQMLQEALTIWFCC